MTRLELAQQLLARTIASKYALCELDVYILMEAYAAPISVTFIMKRTRSSRTTVRRHLRHLMKTFEALSMETTFKNQRGRRTTYTITDGGIGLVNQLLK